MQKRIFALNLITAKPSIEDHTGRQKNKDTIQISANLLIKHQCLKS
jgi:hypothetical protein